MKLIHAKRLAELEAMDPLKLTASEAREMRELRRLFAKAMKGPPEDKARTWPEETKGRV